ncbi:MAG: sigma-54-dependent Fis family transcriptional regulator [Pirellulales bacterium]|nr:sigma-54-dependent Fis family transcriptional regulator [Pirellulales bacterium]
MAHILIVDDEPSICWGLNQLAVRLGHTAAVAPSAEQALSAVRGQPPEVIFLDVRLPGMDGLKAMDRFREALGTVAIVVMTAYGELATAVEAVRKGAFEYLVKPFDLNVAQRILERALARPAAEATKKTGMQLVSQNGSEGDPRKLDASALLPPEQRLIGSSPVMQEVFKRIAVVAPTEACVHLRGESGTGKELMARAIHRYSRRSAGPFVAVNIASLSPTLAESELFGHVRGAFTGAEQTRKGLLEQAHGGTLFFDEVADIPPSTQVKLLRVLEFGEILPVGATQPVRSDFRVISATHQNLHQRVVEGTFRHDLYFRLITFEIDIPPLRRRRGDLAELAGHFLDLLAARNGSPRVPLDDEMLSALEKRPWYGNVRELRNALEHALILARGGVPLPEHLPPPTPPGADALRTREAMLDWLIRDWALSELKQEAVGDLYARLLRIVEPPLLEAAMQRHGGQFLAAAKQLGLHRVTLKRKVSHYRDSAAPSS